MLAVATARWVDTLLLLTTVAEPHSNHLDGNQHFTLFFFSQSLKEANLSVKKQFFKKV